MTTALRRTTGLVLAGLFAIACGGSPAATVPSSIPTLAPGASPIVVPDQPLEDLFPDTVGGNTLNVQSAQGQSVQTLFGGMDPTRFNQFLTDIGASIDQISAASTFGLWPPPSEGGEATGLTAIALRVRDVPAATTIENLQTVVRDQVAEDAPITPATVAGKQVVSISDPDDPQDTLYLYGIGDVVLMIGGTPAHVEEFLSQLP